MTILQQIALLVLNERKAQNLTQEQLAKLANVYPKDISSIENARSIKKADEVIKALGKCVKIEI